MLRRVFFIPLFDLVRASTIAACLLLASTLLVTPFSAYAQKAAQSIVNTGEIKLGSLPLEAQTTISVIRKGGPFPYPKDGVVFGNREKVLPKQPRGFYTEYTVKTPGERSRGARRIVVCGEPRSSTELYYTDDHYATFKRIKE
jgi:ribonuclease T1